MSTVSSRGRLPVARRDRRPMLAALAILLILLGALGSALVAFRSGDRESVLMANRDIKFGQRITQADLVEVRAAAEEGDLLEAEYLDDLEGWYATTAIPAGTLVSAPMFAEGQHVPEDGTLVGLVLDATRRPSTMPRPGQVVAIYYVTGPGGGGGAAARAPGDLIVDAARVVSAGRAGGGDTAGLTVLVRSTLAGELADHVSAGRVAITLLPDDTTPSIDFPTG